MKREQEILLGVLSQALTGKKYNIPDDTDWAALYRESKLQAVAPLVFSCVSEQCDNPEVFAKWKTFTMRALQNNMNVHLQHNILHAIMTENGIPYVIIKGCASAKDYPDPLLRAMGDVDFLVHDCDLEKAKQILVSHGFEFCEDNPFHVVFHKKNFEMEMHHDPFGLDGEKAKVLQDLVPELIDNSVEVNVGTAQFRMSDPFGHGIVILLHAYRHLQDSGIGIRHLCDWAAFISGFSNEEFIRIFQARSEELGIWKLVQVFSTTAHLYLSVPYQAWMGKINREICDMLMRDIFDSGNFGVNNKERWTQNQALYTETGELSEDAGGKRLLHAMNIQAIVRYPKLMKVAILRPFGWVIIGVRYVFRVLTGKRKKAPSNTMEMVAMRKKLYQQMKVFEK